MLKAAIIGGTGYGGAELCRQLLQHPEVELTRVSAIDHVGELLGDVHLNLEGVTDLRFEDIPAKEAAAGVDAVLLGLPHTVSSKVVGELRETDVRIIDMSGDFRLRDVDTYNAYYNTTHPHPELLDSFTYGLPELNRSEIKASRRIACPGCFATCTALGLLPLAKGGVLKRLVGTVACTGSSGSGAYAKDGTHHPVRAANLKAYNPLKHRHAPEVEQTLRAAGAGEGFHLDFVPISAPLVRGILATSMVEIDADVTEHQVTDFFESTYSEAPFVKLPKQRLPQVVAIAGTNFAEVGFTFGPQRGDVRTLVVLSAIDNLVKGGAGQALQCMNLTLGLAENAGLVGDFGIWP